ncbi:MAG: flavin reductase [Bacteroidota bacterium]
MRKPWNIPDFPVYSLSTQKAGKGNMNICTYVSAVSMKPKVYMIAAYQNTQTLINLESSDTAVLQLLEQSQFGLIKHLGKMSGTRFDKIAWLRKRGLLSDWIGFPVISNVCSLVFLKKIKVLRLEGDHVLFLFSVEKHKSFSENYLTTNILKNKNIIR